MDKLLHDTHMTTEQIIESIYNILKKTMALPNMDSFRPEARLNEDLHLDSVMVLDLIVSLELEYGLSIPDNALMKNAFRDVRGLAMMLDQIQSKTEIEKDPEEFEDIKVHCFVSCICEIIKESPKVDYRPFYFGVWDSEIIVTDQYRISNHSDTINHDFFRTWYKKLYGVDITPWYDSRRSKEENINKLCSLIETKAPYESIMVMLDMYLLPERENKFNKDPFPHYVLLKKSQDPELLFMHDPDFRWEGELRKDSILNAINQPCVSGGYLFDERQITATTPEAIHAYFEACMDNRENPMTNAIRNAVDAHVAGVDKLGNSLSIQKLSVAFNELPLLAIRKYAYEPGFAFFWRALSLDDDEFEHWCDVIADLVETYTQIQYRAMKLAATEDRELFQEIHLLLKQQDQREFRIKARLNEVFEAWLKTVFDH